MCYPTSCHTKVLHEIGPMLTTVHSPAICDRCHRKDVHLWPRGIYRGSGGIGVPDSPSLMFTLNIDCIACHRKGEGSLFLHIERYAERTVAEACVDCHGEGFEDTLKHWKSILSKMENETNQRIFNAQKVLYEFERGRGGSSEFKRLKPSLTRPDTIIAMSFWEKGFTISNMPLNFSTKPATSPNRP